MSQPRYRDEVNQSTSALNYSIVGYGPSPPAPSSGVIGTGSVSGSYRYIQDHVTKGFRKTRNFRQWVMNPYSLGKVTSLVSSGSATTSNTPDGSGRGLTRTWSGDGLGYLFGPLVNAQRTAVFGSYPDLVNVENLKGLAIIGCLNRINPAKSQSLIIAAEAHKTVDMILSRAKKLALFYVAFKRGDRKLLEKISGKKITPRYPRRYVLWDDRGQPIVKVGRKRPVARYGHKTYTSAEYSRLDQAARLELEYRYGWTPLVHDIVDSLKALNEAALRASLRQFDFTRVFEVKTNQRESNVVLSVTKDGGTFGCTQNFKHTVEVKAYAKYHVVEPSGLTNRLNDFGIYDIPRAVWDLATLSFVADWFIPIGDWLGALSPKVGVEVIDGGVTLVATKAVTRTLVSYTPTSSGVGQWPVSPFPIGSVDSFTTVGKVRTLGLPVPLLPPHEVKLNFKRLADAVALFRVMR